MYALPLEPASLPAPTPPLWVIAEHQAERPVFHSNFPRAVSHMVVCIYVRATLSIHPALSFHLCVHESLLYICVSIPAMQTA